MTGDETRFQEAGAKCPVCQWPGQGTPRCRICGWQMIGGYVAGAATPADHQALASRLAEARQQHDIQAAVRAVSADGGSDPARLAWLAGCARGGAPSASQLERMAAAVVHEDTRRQAASPERTTPWSGWSQGRSTGSRSSRSDRTASPPSRW